MPDTQAARDRQILRFTLRSKGLRRWDPKQRGTERKSGIAGSQCIRRDLGVAQINALGLRRCWSWFPSKGLKNGFHFFEPQPNEGTHMYLKIQLPVLNSWIGELFQADSGWKTARKKKRFIPPDLGNLRIPSLWCWGSCVGLLKSQHI